MSCVQIPTISGALEFKCALTLMDDGDDSKCNKGCPHSKRHRHKKSCDQDCPVEKGLPEEIEKALDKRPEAFIDMGRRIILE